MKKLKALMDYLLAKYEWMLSLLLKLRQVKVDREKYITGVVRRYLPDDRGEALRQALASSPAEVMTHEQLDKAYRRLIRRHGLMVFGVSFVFTLTPEDLWIVIVACTLDLVIFQCVLFVAMQKIMMLYGPACDLHKEESEGVKRIIAIDSSGLMIGKYPLLQKMKSVLGWLSKQAVKRMGPKVVAKLSRSAFIVLRRQAVKWASVLFTKEYVTMAFEALIPLTCAVISGIVSAVIFVPMCNKLRKHLIEQ